MITHGPLQAFSYGMQETFITLGTRSPIILLGVGVSALIGHLVSHSAALAAKISAVVLIVLQGFAFSGESIRSCNNRIFRFLGNVAALAIPITIILITLKGG
ncbi:MAG: hypothetical protein JSR76_00200 [Verrucomicrobia bacterium]|nr:hypothetical protein [Verrucomicrobiota bacterium]